MDAIRCVLTLLLGLVLLGSAISVASAKTISEIKASAAIGTEVTVTGAVTYVEENDCYIQSTDRSSGIWVQAPTAGIGVGSIVTATGTYSIVSGEPAITGATLTPETGLLSISPFTMNNSAIGGNLPELSIWDYRRVKIPGDGSELKWIAAKGAPNTGMLVKTSGTVNAVYYSPVNNIKWFYIDDGRGVLADLTDAGVLVYSDADVRKGQLVTATGVSSVEPALDDSSKLIRVLRTRSASDVQAYDKPVEQIYPFSDEFNTRTLDPRWVTSHTLDHYSLAALPGMVEIGAGGSNPAGPDGYVAICQPIPGDWDMEIRMHVNPNAIPIGGTRSIYICNRYAAIDPNNFIARFAVTKYSTQLFQRIYFGSSYGFDVPRDTCYLRIRARGNLFYRSYSIDGLHYLQEYITSRTNILISIGSEHSVISRMQHNMSYAAYIDYVRIRTAGQ